MTPFSKDVVIRRNLECHTTEKKDFCDRRPRCRGLTRSSQCSGSVKDSGGNNGDPWLGRSGGGCWDPLQLHEGNTSCLNTPDAFRPSDLQTLRYPAVSWAWQNCALMQPRGSYSYYRCFCPQMSWAGMHRHTLRVQRPRAACEERQGLNGTTVPDASSSIASIK